MPKINTYPIVSDPLLTAKLIGTDVAGTPPNQTKNFTVEQLGNTLGFINKTVKVTSAELLNLVGNSIELVEASGENKTYDIWRAYMYFEFNTTAYSATADLTIRMGGVNLFVLDNQYLFVSQNTIFSLSPTTFNAPAIGLSTATFPAQYQTGSAARIAAWNTPAYTGNNNIELSTIANPILGDGDLYVKLTYRIIDTTVTTF